MLRLLIDSNIIVSAIIARHGNPRRLLQLWRAGRYDVVTTQEQIDELTDVLRRPKFVGKADVDEVREVLFLMATRAESVPPITTSLNVRDPEDEVLLGAALAGNADYLITGDRDLLVLNGDPRLGALQIVTVADFFRLTSS